MQMIMFITLGMLVTPGKIYAIMPLGFALSAVLIFIARPLSVFISLFFSHFTFRHKLFISWVGLLMGR